MTDSGSIDVTRDGPVAVLSLDHPPGHRLTQAMVQALSSHVAALEKDTEVRSVILTGTGGRAFCEGLDTEEWASFSPKDAQSALQRGFEALWGLEHLPKPAIAAVEGSCLGVGAELALACDLRVASRSARFGFPEIDAGWMPSHGGTARLPRIVGRARALELVLGGAAIGAREAFEIGLIEHVVARGAALRKAQGLARTFAAKPRTAVHAIKRALTEGEEKPYRNRFLLETQHSVQLFWTDAYREAQAKVRRKAP